MTQVLVVPAHWFLSDSMGSEPTWAYNIMANVSSRFGTSFFALCNSKRIVKERRLVKVIAFSTEAELRPTARVKFLLNQHTTGRALLRTIRFDTVHHMFPFGFRRGFNSLALTGSLRDLPFVVGPIQLPQTFSDVYDAMFVTGRGLQLAEAISKLEDFVLKRAGRLLNKLHESTLGRASLIVFDSGRTRDLYKRSYGPVLQRKEMTIIPPGVETNFFKFKPPADRDSLEILTVGPLVRRKGIQFLLYALGDVKRRTKRNIQLRVVGDGPFRNSLRELAVYLGLQRDVIFEGHVEREKLPPYYESCDLFIQPSISESFPSSVREAMAVGRPVIASRVGFIDEHIAHGVNGYLFPPGHFTDLTNLIVELTTDVDLRRKIGIEARRYAEEHFNWDSISREWQRVYRAA